MMDLNKRNEEFKVHMRVLGLFQMLLALCALGLVGYAGYTLFRFVLT